MKPNNIVADYKVVTTTCQICRGMGRILFENKDDLRKYLNVIDVSFSFGELRGIYKAYLQRGDIDCDVCNGEGTIEEWI